MTKYAEHTIRAFQADADLSSYQYYFVEHDASLVANYVQVAVAGSTTVPLGILWDDPTVAGQHCEVVVSGECKVRANAASAITYGMLMGFDSSGRATPVVVGTSSSNAWVMGRFMEALASGSAIIRCELWHGPAKLGTS